MGLLGQVSTLVNGLVYVLWLVLDLALLAIALTVVQKRCAEASLAMCVSAIVSAFCTIGSPVWGLVAARRAFTTADAVSVLMAGQLVLSLFRMLAWGMLLYGIVKLMTRDPNAAQGPGLPRHW